MFAIFFIYQQLASYLKIVKNCEWMFIENERSGFLKVYTRKRLINALADLIDEEYAGKANDIEIMHICVATIGLFKCLEGQDDDIRKIVCEICKKRYLTKFVFKNVNVFFC